MSTHRVISKPGIHPRRKVALVAVLLFVVAIAVPATARTGSIRAVGNGDIIFVYEENLDISGLRSGANPVTSLRKYENGNTGNAILQEIPVQDDTSFTVYEASVGGEFGTYHAYNPTDGNTGKTVRIAEPKVTIDIVLADPNHTDSVQGLSISDTTAVAFKISAPQVAASYRYDAVYPATVDVVLITPGGAQLTDFQGRDFTRQNISAQEFYTDDPGRPGSITYRGLSEGTYQVQAQWRNPVFFDSQAPDSNIVSFTIGRASPTTTATTPATPRPTTPSPTAPATPATTTVVVTATTPATTAPLTPSPTTAGQAAVDPVIPLAAAGILLTAAGLRRRG